MLTYRPLPLVQTITGLALEEAQAIKDGTLKPEDSESHKIAQSAFLETVRTDGFQLVLQALRESEVAAFNGLQQDVGVNSSFYAGMLHAATVIRNSLISILPQDDENNLSEAFELAEGGGLYPELPTD